MIPAATAITCKDICLVTVYKKLVIKLENRSLCSRKPFLKTKSNFSFKVEDLFNLNMK